MERLKLNIQKFATSGTLTTPNNTDGTSFYFTWSRQSYSIADNKSTIYWQIGINAAYSYQSNAVKLGPTTVNGTVIHSGGTYSNISRGTHTMFEGTMDIYHNPDGTKSFSASLSGWTWESTWTSADNSNNPFVLNTIPRYTTVSTWSVKSRTETSITMSWKTADNVSAIKYGINTSSPTTTSNLNKNSGEVTISGLTEGQTYTLYFMPQRKDSGLWGDGSSNTWKSLTNQSPIPYPYCSSAPNFTIGNNVTLQLYNPLNRPVELQMYSFVGGDFINVPKISTNVNGEFSFPASDYTQQLYDSIPEAKSSQYNIDVWYNGHKSINGGNSYSVDENNCRPTFSNFTYADTNATTVALTGNNQKVVRGYSNITATISTANKATVATGKGSNLYMKRYDLIIDGNGTNNANYSDNSDVTITTNGANSGSIKVSAVDSRNIAREVPKTADVIPYTNIQRGNISVTRAGNVGEATTLTFDGTLWEGNFGAVTNTITSVQYRYKSTASGSSWSAYTSLTPPTPSGSSYSFSNLIAGDDGNNGFTVDNSFNIEVVVSDRLSSITFTATLGTGIPHVAFGNNGIAIKQPYDDNDSSVLQVNGKTNIKNDLSVTGKITATGNIEASGKLKGNSFTRNTTDTWIPVLNQGYLDYTLRDIWTAKTHSGYNTNQDYLVTKSCLSWWNGAYNSGGSSNLTYAHQGTIQCKPTNLYNNSSGTTGTVNLSQSCANFTYIDIYFCDTLNGNPMQFVRVYSPNGQYVALQDFSRDGNNIRCNIKKATPSGTSITTQYGFVVYMIGGAKYDTNEMKIVRVDGWK